MATTTAAVTLTSDLLSNAMSVSTDTTLMKAGTTADGLTQVEHSYIEIATGDQYDLICTTPTASKASKLYVKNHSTDETYYVIITIDATVVGRLYAGDWMFIPWSQTDTSAQLEIQASVATTMPIEYMLMHEGYDLADA